MDSLTEEQKTLIEDLKTGGYGWAKFARNVEEQGWCSQKQYDTMKNMHNQLNRQRRWAEKPRRVGRYRKARWDSFDSISDMYESGYEGWGDNNGY